MLNAPPTCPEQATAEEHDTRALLDAALTEGLADEERADGKIRDLLGLFGVLAAITLTLASRDGRPTGATVTLWIAAAPMLAALVRLLLMVRPQVANAPFARYARHTTQMICAEFRRDSEAFVATRAARLQARSTAINRKYRGIRDAVHLVLLGGTGLITALILTVIG